MKFRMFDLAKPLPFSQGYAIKEVHRTFGGKVVAAGDCGQLLYVKLQSKNTAEVVYVDDGLSITPKHLRIDSEVWSTRGPDGFEVDPSFTVEVAA